ncbi:hypothetical protein B0H14DRAFT_3508931 [Mycena olivaceomarginata]|nr:hypothetical protein B0H14DRAFT_3508931 [Mycena olivaceomarginata]
MASLWPVPEEMETRPTMETQTAGEAITQIEGVTQRHVGEREDRPRAEGKGAPGAPYGTMVPTIDPKLKVESLPEWDGSLDTAIDYFWEVV